MAMNFERYLNSMPILACAYLREVVFFHMLSRMHANVLSCKAGGRWLLNTGSDPCTSHGGADAQGD
jgi:hypothetical protein